MSKLDLQDKATEKHDPYTDAGRGLRHQLQEQEKFNQLASTYDSQSADPAQENANIAKLNARESEGTIPYTPQNQTSSSNSGKKRWQFLTSKKIRGKSSLLAVIAVLFGGGAALTVLFSPTIAIVQLKEVFTQDLNDQLRSLDTRSAVLLRSKLKDTTKGSCGAVKITCRFSTLHDDQVKKFKAQGIEIDRDMSKGIGGKRGQITRMTFTNPTSGEKTYITNAAELKNASLNNMAFRSSLITSYNPKVIGFADKVAAKVFAKNGARKSLQINGSTDEERQKSVNSIVEKKASVNASSIVTKTDEDGNKTYTDDKGNPLTSEEVEQARQSSERISALAEIGSSKTIQNLAKGAMITGVIDTSCTIYNTSRMVSALSKVKKKEQAVRFATTMILTPADAMKANEATEEMVSFVGDNITQTNTEEKVIDESRATEPGTASNPPMVENKDFGKSGLDSPAFRLAAHDDVPKLDMRASRFMLGDSTPNTFDGIAQALALSLSLGTNPDPQSISDKCKFVQNPAVRLGALAIGIIAGAGTAGLSTVAMITGSVAIGAMLPYLESVLADIITGNLFKDLEGMDTVDAAFVGTAGLTGDMAMARGMKPLDDTEAVEASQENAKVAQAYSEVERYQAKDTPLDITNQYSFLGSIAFSLTPYVRQSASSLGTMAMSVGNLLPASLAVVAAPKLFAASPIQRFQQCNDVNYLRLGIKADVFCNVRYGNSKEELALDPIENANWMAATGNIDPESEDGVAKDNGDKGWNYVKFLKECVNRSTGWGENQDENTGDGAECRKKENEPLNMRYRIYTMDVSVDQSLDGSKSQKADPGTTGSASGATGNVTEDGWSYPTTTDGNITSGFKTAARPDHRGVDITHSGGSLNKPIFAARDGKVIAAGPAEGFGNWIIIRHQVDGKTIDSLYGHMYNDGVLVKQGDTIKAGQEIGKIGSDGQSTGPHLHFELWDGGRISDNGQVGKETNPEPILQKAKNAQPGNRSRDV